MKKIIFPKVGMRIIKTTIAVFLCAIIGYFRGQVPFYSMIAAVLCLQSDLSSSFKSALTRTIGTFIGGAFGLVILLITEYAHIPPLSILYYSIVAVCTIPIIYTTVLLERKPSSYITCVVFFSITVSHIIDEMPILFVWHRVSDTLIGIGVSLFINYIIPYKNKDSDSKQIG